MINSLFYGIAAVLAVTVLLFVLFEKRSAGGRDSRAVRGLLYSVLFLAMAAGAGVYALNGRWSDWQHQQVDETRDHRLAAKITEARRVLQLNPKNTEALVRLAHLYLDGGLFQEAADTVERAQALSPKRADLPGLKAQALYYRDGRVMSADAKRAVEEAFAIDPMEIQSHMLLAQDDFFNERYEQAIERWQRLLDSHVDPSKTAALQNAINTAKNKLALARSK
jgi:formate-dependent nitrite reductase complex subunit NrfG